MTLAGILDGLNSGVTLGGIHVSFGLIVAAVVVVGAFALFVAFKLAGRVIVSVATAIVLGWLTSKGWISVW